jgi:hypothetical protein
MPALGPAVHAGVHHSPPVAGCEHRAGVCGAHLTVARDVLQEPQVTCSHSSSSSSIH